MRLPVFLLAALPALSHEGEPLAPHDLVTAWAWDPLVVTGLAISAWLYWRGSTQDHGIARWERWCYWAGWWSLVVALISPLHPLGEVLFSAHMVQHEVLMLISAPLLVLGRPLVPYLWGVPQAWRRYAGTLSRTAAVNLPWRWVSRPVNAWWIHAAALWGWHTPILFQATISSDVVHTLQHLSFLLSALLFWWSLMSGREASLGYGMSVFYVFSTAVHTSVLGALLAFSKRVWYPIYSDKTLEWGLTPIEDQQLGGLVMWVPGGVILLAAGLWLFARWIHEPARRRASGMGLLLVMLVLCGCTPDLQFQDKYAVAQAATGGSPHNGKRVIELYGCGSCHQIPGIPGANGLVGPPLTKMASRTYIAGVLTNTPDNMVRWIKDPPAVDRLTAMPKLGVDDTDARDATAYIYTLR